MNELDNENKTKSLNRISYRNTSKGQKQKATDLIPFPLNIVHIDNPKNGNKLFRKNKNKKVSLQVPNTMIIRRSFTSDLKRYKKQYAKKANLSLNHGGQMKKQSEDEILFSDKKFTFKENINQKEIQSEEISKINKDQKNIHKNSLNIEDQIEEQEQEQNERQRLERYLRQEEQNKREREKEKSKRKNEVERYQFAEQTQITNNRRHNQSKNERRSYFPQLKINALTSHSYRRRVHASQYVQIEEKDELKGWALQGEQVDKRIDIIEYAKKSLCQKKSKSMSNK